MIDAKDRFASVRGERIHYLETGSGPPVLLLHTGGASAYEFEAAIGALARQHRAIAWDMPGHGDSDPILAHRGISEYGDILAEFIAALNLQDTIVVGASIGGYIAMDLACRHPSRVSRVVLAEAPLRSKAWYDSNWFAFEAMCAIPTTRFETTAPRFRALTPAQHGRWNIDRNKAGGWTLVDIAWAVRDFDPADALANVRVPVSAIMGAVGPTIGEMERWKDMRPDMPIHVLRDCGHFVMIDDPEGFVEAVTLIP